MCPHFILTPPTRMLACASPPYLARIENAAESMLLQGHATSDHTTLLLNCYSKLKDIQKLEAFLRRTGATGDNATLQFDTEVAVKVSLAGCWLVQAV